VRQTATGRRHDFTFYKARGIGVGKSLVEEDKLELAKSGSKAKERGIDLLLPTDVVAISCYGCECPTVLTTSPMMDGSDIGPDSVKMRLQTARR